MREADFPPGKRLNAPSSPPVQNVSGRPVARVARVLANVV